MSDLRSCLVSAAPAAVQDLLRGIRGVHYSQALPAWEFIEAELGARPGTAFVAVSGDGEARLGWRAE